MPKAKDGFIIPTSCHTVETLNPYYLKPILVIRGSESARFIQPSFC
jgi:hypothetical protein